MLFGQNFCKTVCVCMSACGGVYVCVCLKRRQRRGRRLKSDILRPKRKVPRKLEDMLLPIQIPALRPILYYIPFE